MTGIAARSFSSGNSAASRSPRKGPRASSKPAPASSKAPTRCRASSWKTEEETGIRLTSEPRRLFEAYSSPGSFAERLTYFVAPYKAEDRVAKGGGLVNEGEDIEVIETTLEKAVAMVERGEIVDIKTIAHLYWAKATRLMDKD